MRGSLLLAPMLAACVSTRSASPPVPRVDYHQHLVSPPWAPVVQQPQRDARKLLAQLDSAGITKAVVLSVGYSYGDERKNLPNPDQLTRAENDWTSAQVMTSGGRLIGFCSANPLRPVALAEIERCLGLPGMKGIKLHFGNAGITLRNAEHAARMAQAFAMAERLRVPILVHMRARGGSNYGAEDARLFLDKLVAVAPSIEIVVAHLGYTGPGYPADDDVMAAFGAAARANDPRMRNVFFDVASNVHGGTTRESAAVIADRIRQVGVQRVLYGSDLDPPGGSIAAGWRLFHEKLPLTEAEFRTIAGNLTRFAR